MVTTLTEAYAATSADIAELLHTHYAGPTERIYYFPPGIDTQRFRPGIREAARDMLGLARAPFTMLWVGRLTPVDKADLMPLLLTLQIVLTRAARLFLNVSSTELIPPGELFFAVLLITLANGLAMGLIFPLACKALGCVRKFRMRMR